jgi:hypothetical protein
MSMLLLKACPRCGGDMSLEREQGCAYFECLQCTHVLSFAQERMMHVSARQLAAQQLRRARARDAQIELAASARVS